MAVGCALKTVASSQTVIVKKAIGKGGREVSAIRYDLEKAGRLQKGGGGRQ